MIFKPGVAASKNQSGLQSLLIGDVANQIGNAIMLSLFPAQ